MSAHDRATPKQVRYAFSLLEKAIPGARVVDARHQTYGAPAARVGKSIDGWLATLTWQEISALIDRLKKETEA